MQLQVTVIRFVAWPDNKNRLYLSNLELIQYDVISQQVIRVGFISNTRY